MCVEVDPVFSFNLFLLVFYTEYSSRNISKLDSGAGVFLSVPTTLPWFGRRCEGDRIIDGGRPQGL